jgi:iron complex outermembrane receptor protein
MAVVISRDRKTIRYGALLLSAAWLALPGAASAQRASDAPADIRVIGHRDPEGLLPDQTEPRRSARFPPTSSSSRPQR